METDRFQVLCLMGTVIGMEGTYIHISLCTLMDACIGPRVMDGESNEKRRGYEIDIHSFN